MKLRITTSGCQWQKQTLSGDVTLMVGVSPRGLDHCRCSHVATAILNNMPDWFQSINHLQPNMQIQGPALKTPECHFNHPLNILLSGVILLHNVQTNCLYTSCLANQAPKTARWFYSSNQKLMINLKVLLRIFSHQMHHFNSQHCCCWNHPPLQVVHNQHWAFTVFLPHKLATIKVIDRLIDLGRSYNQACKFLQNNKFWTW